MPTASNIGLAGSIVFSSGGQTFNFPVHQYLEGAEIELVTGGAWTMRLRLWDPDGDALEKVVIAAGSDRNLDFTFGWDDETDPLLKLFRGSVLSYQPEFLPHGTYFNAEIVARSQLTSVADRQIRSFEEGLLISDIVQRIAQDRGWAFLIEPTADLLERPFSTRGESDLKFIREHLLPQAVTPSGQGGYLAYFDNDDVFHFHTPNFGESQSYSYRFARDMSGDVISFLPQDSTYFGALMGGGNSVYSSAASRDGGTSEKVTTQTGGIDNAGVPTPFDASAKPNIGTGVHSYQNLDVRSPEEVERRTRARYDTFRRYAYQANLKVHGTHRIDPLDFITVEYIKTDGTLHYLSGSFQVFKVMHEVGVGVGWTTRFELLREGISVQEGTTEITATETITPTPATSAAGTTTITAQ